MMYQGILLGKVDIGAAVGSESMSNVPYLIMDARSGLKMGNKKLVDALYNDGMIDAFYDILMGETAENVAKNLSTSRGRSRMNSPC